MRKIAVRLTDYVISRGKSEESRDIYEYGFQTALEVIFSLIASFMIMIMLHMPLEGILFFVIFIPIRTYAGGFHLERYIWCFFWSSLIFTFVLFLVKYLMMPGYCSIIAISILLAAIWWLYPAEHINRPIDEDEKKYFRRKLGKVLSLDIILSMIFFILKKDNYLFLVSATLFVIVITMVLGKLTYKRTVKRLQKSVVKNY